MQGAGFIQRPHFLGVLGLLQLRGKTPEVGSHVADVALQHVEGVVVARRIHRLGQVDDHRARRRKQHVELGQVTVHQAGAQHQHDLGDQEGVVFARLVRVQHYVVQTRRRIAVLIGHQFHQQHAFKKVVRLGHANARTGQAEQRRHFSVLPGIFGFFLAELGALGHGSRLAAVTDLTAFLVFGRLTKTSFIRLLVNLGATQFIAAAHHINSCFFTTHQRAQHFVDQTVFDQGFNAFRSLHQLLLWVLYYQTRVWHSLYGNRLAGGRGY